MAAGLGFKTFTTGEVLTAANVNGYLMQGVLVFASAAARDAAITSPQEGQFAYTKDTNGLWYYDGAAWVASGATGDIEGVTAGIGISGGGTSGTVTVTNSMATAIDAKGDLVAGTGADTFAKLTVGANNTVLTADSAEATGLKWATPASGGGMTLLSSTTLSGTSTTISSISQDYTDLFLFCNNATLSSSAGFFIYFNGDTTSTNYYASRFTIDTSTISGDQNNTSEMFQTGTATGWSDSGMFVLNIPRYSVTENHYAYGHCRTKLANYRTNWSTFQWNNTAAISSISFANAGGRTWSTGTVRLYGVK